MARACMLSIRGHSVSTPEFGCHAMLGRVIGRPARLPDEAAERGTVDDGAATL